MKNKSNPLIEWTDCKPTGRSVNRIGIIMYEYIGLETRSNQRLRVFLTDKAFKDGRAIRAK